MRGWRDGGGFPLAKERWGLWPLMSALLFGGLGHAQLADEFTPPRANCCLVNNAKSLADQLQDWNQLGRYHRANQELKTQQRLGRLDSRA